MQLMTTQLENQDPLNPVDDTAMLAQLAQFSSLQQMQTLNQTMTAASEFSGLQQSASLIGMNVTTTNSDGSAGPSGQVTSVSMQSGVPYLTISGESVAASTVTTITTPSSGS
jgi:flagellar basal-body rod modification protein FlgD